MVPHNELLVSFSTAKAGIVLSRRVEMTLHRLKTRPENPTQTFSLLHLLNFNYRIRPNTFQAANGKKMRRTHPKIAHHHSPGNHSLGSTTLPRYSDFYETIQRGRKEVGGGKWRNALCGNWTVMTLPLLRLTVGRWRPLSFSAAACYPPFLPSPAPGREDSDEGNSTATTVKQFPYKTSQRKK